MKGSAANLHGAEIGVHIQPEAGNRKRHGIFLGAKWIIAVFAGNIAAEKSRYRIAHIPLGAHDHVIVDERAGLELHEHAREGGAFFALARDIFASVTRI